MGGVTPPGGGHGGTNGAFPYSSFTLYSLLVIHWQLKMGGISIQMTVSVKGILQADIKSHDIDNPVAGRSHMFLSVSVC